jgi:ubiquitin C-terminal hydrolase
MYSVSFPILTLSTSSLSPPPSQLAKSFGELIRALCTHGRDHDVVAPTDIKRLVGSYAPRFLGYNQQDSQEFLRFLLDGLHEDLNLVRQVWSRSHSHV